MHTAFRAVVGSCDHEVAASASPPIIRSRTFIGYDLVLITIVISKNLVIMGLSQAERSRIFAFFTSRRTLAL
ncbi:hypothetical protein [Tolypothrix sp. VBCCA 56010]|uniref:hypothetical protein n=1 Tax=Tolypothrix sp. VBCCA 56010 TaxID=3137731 RepID=UPI003D7DAD69